MLEVSGTTAASTRSRRHGSHSRRAAGPSPSARRPSGMRSLWSEVRGRLGSVSGWWRSQGTRLRRGGSRRSAGTAGGAWAMGRPGCSTCAGQAIVTQAKRRGLSAVTYWWNCSLRQGRESARSLWICCRVGSASRCSALCGISCGRIDRPSIVGGVGIPAIASHVGASVTAAAALRRCLAQIRVAESGCAHNPRWCLSQDIRRAGCRGRESHPGFLSRGHTVETCWMEFGDAQDCSPEDRETIVSATDLPGPLSQAQRVRTWSEEMIK